MKKNRTYGLMENIGLLKIIKIMRFTIFILFLSLSQAFAVDSYSQQTKLSLDLKNAKVEEVLDKIEKSSEFFFMYNKGMVDVERKIDIQVEGKGINQILDKVFENTGISYSIKDRQILLINNSMANNGAENMTQQQKSVSGKVADSTGALLPGVSVVVKGTTTGVITDSDGKYTLANVPTNATLQFSFVGMKTQEIAVEGKATINVSLAEETVGIEEVVAVGYGTQKKATLTGAISAINSKDLKTVNTSNLANQLAGKLPGLRVVQRNGEPGGYAGTFDIRGFGSPLVVINGVVSGVSDFVRLNPLDIDQVTILKDASAAIYGVKAANGVVLVTTKRGELGKPKITYSGSYSLSQIINLPDQCNAYEFALLTTQNQINHGTAPGATTFSAADLQNYKDGTYPSTDWLKLMIVDFSPKQTHSINITGGNEKIKYFTSFGSINETGIYRSKDLKYDKYNIRSSVTGKINENLEIELNLEGMIDKRYRHPYADMIGSAWIHALPTVTEYANNNPDYYSEVIDGQHTVALTTIADVGSKKAVMKTFHGLFTLNYKVPFIKGLDAKFMYGYYYADTWDKTFLKAVKQYKYDKPTDTYVNTLTKFAPSTLTGTFTAYNRWTLLSQLNYNISFKEKHNVKASLVFEERHDMNDNLQASKQFSIDIDQFYAGTTNPTVTSSNIYENDNQSVVGRFNYDYLSKYLIEAGFNYGGSSKFPKGHRWGFFPYTTLGWRLSEESFIKDNISFLTNFKLRGSIGIMGDDAASSFQFVTGYSYPSGNYIIGDTPISGLGFRSIPNPNITWYTINSKNIGFDASIKSGLLNFSLDLFRRDRSGLLATRILTMPGTVGATLSQENLNKDMREGLEIVIGQSRKLGEFSYDIAANVTYTRGQGTYIERTPDGNSYLDWRNNSTNRWDNITWGYKYIGQFQSQDELNNSPIQDSQGNRTLLPGDLKYEDINKDGLITSVDQIPIARGNTPDINFGLNGTVSYKGFDLAFLIQGSANYDHARQGNLRGPLPWNRNTFKIYLDNWHHEDLYDVNSPWVPGKYPAAATQGSIPSNSWNSRFWIENAAYVRLKSLEIGYTLDKALLSKLLIQNFRVFVSGYNLLTWDRLTGVDPEILGDSHYPITRDFTLGINVTF